MSRESGSATAIGAAAIGLWACLAALTGASRTVPTFEALAITFAIAAVAALVGFTAMRGWSGVKHGLTLWPRKAWILTTVAIFAYHALYFAALRLAPPAQASLINYLWPLLIVLFSGLIPGGTTKLGPPQILGAVMGFAATLLLVGGPGPVEASGTAMAGYLAALVCAFTWSLYSVLNNRINAPGSEPMIVVCAVVALLAALCHVAIGETFVMPDFGASLSLLALGIGPIGAAFVAWDHATKHGRLALLGAMSYAAPPLSTLILVLTGQAEPSLMLLAATLLVVAGAGLAAFGGRKRGGVVPTSA